MGVRRQARECALMVLFGIDLGRASAAEAIQYFFDRLDSGEALDPIPSYCAEAPEKPAPLSAEAREYAEGLVRGVVETKTDLDERIQTISSHWRLERMACVDLNILRLGAYEIVHRSDEIPVKVALNEAIELAKTFGTAESPAFVNGLLDKLVPR